MCVSSRQSLHQPMPFMKSRVCRPSSPQDKAENELLGRSIARTLNLGLMAAAIGHLLVLGTILNHVRGSCATRCCWDAGPSVKLTWRRAVHVQRPHHGGWSACRGAAPADAALTGRRASFSSICRASAVSCCRPSQPPGVRKTLQSQSDPMPHAQVQLPALTTEVGG